MTCKHYDKEFMCCKLYSDWSMGMPELAICTIPCKDYSAFTNYDRIRNMSIEEMADLFCRIKEDYQWREPTYPAEDDAGGWKEWLKSEVKE